MKNIRRFFAALLVLVCLVTTFGPVRTAEAATKSLAANTWQKVTVVGNYYKITIKGEGYVTLYVKSASGSLSAELLNSNKETFSLEDDVYSGYATGTTKSVVVPVSAGTYYIRPMSVYNVGYLKYTFTSITQADNYCKAKAVKVSSNTQVKVYQTPEYSYDRYFKITISSSRVLKFYTYGGTFNLYDSKGKSIDYDSESLTNSTYTRKYTTGKLAAGTYYMEFDTWTTYGYAELALWKWCY